MLRILNSQNYIFIESVLCDVILSTVGLLLGHTLVTLLGETHVADELKDFIIRVKILFEEVEINLNLARPVLVHL